MTDLMQMAACAACGGDHRMAVAAVLAMTGALIALGVWAESKPRGTSHEASVKRGKAGTRRDSGTGGSWLMPGAFLWNTKPARPGGRRRSGLQQQQRLTVTPRGAE